MEFYTVDQQNVTSLGNAGSLSVSQNRVLRNTLVLLAISLVPTVMGAALGLSLNFRGFGAWWLNLAVLLAAVFGFSYAIERTKNSSLGVAVMLGFTFFMGFWLSVLLGRVLSLANGATLVMYAFGGTALIFAAMAAVATTIKTSLSGMGKFLWIGFFAILLAGIGAIVFQIPTLMITVLVLFIGLFAAWTLYDLNQIITGGETNYITAATSIYINLFNVFSNLLSLLGLTSND
jgi:modulator of FtsH protease